MLKIRGKNGQLSVFIIVAIVIVAIIAVYLIVRGNVTTSSIPSDLLPVFNYYQSCIEDQAKQAIDIAGVQGGHIYIDNYVPASDYAPFSSQLNFLGFPVPYWYYVTGNGLAKEQVPSKTDIEKNISKYVADGLGNCNFEQFYAQGYSITFGNPIVKTAITDRNVKVNVAANVNVSRGDVSALQTDRSVDISSKLGKFYNLALQIYNVEKSEAFLENYSVDVLRLYAPVDGVEIGCAPKIWRTSDVISQLKQGLAANIGALKFQGGNNVARDKYFVVNQKVDENVNLLYSPSWPTKVDIHGNGVDDALMIADTIGNQPGLGVIGFCYAPYHFVYDIGFPVLVQIYNDQEMFQFPVAVVIDKNLPRQGDYSNANTENQSIDLCAFKTQDIEVSTYDTQLNLIDAEISYGCFNQKCNLGDTKNGKFVGKAPACFNGYLYAFADNYTTAQQLFSSNNERSADMILDRQYNDKINVNVGGAELDGQAIVIFSGATSASASLPGTSSVKLSEGLYNVSVYVYGNSSLVIPASTKTQCMQVSQSGLVGLFGGTKEQCYDIKIPATNVGIALIGGGQSEVYLLESDLQKGELNLNVDKFKVPASLDELQYNYESFDNSGVIVS